MKIVITSPSKAFLVDYTPMEHLELVKLLSYANTAAAYLVKRHANNHVWKSRNLESWESRYQELKAAVNTTLIFFEDGQQFIRPGSIPYITDRINCEVKNEIIYPIPRPMPWAKPLPFELHHYQQEGVSRLLSEKHGNVSFVTGSGKTGCILQVTKELGLNTVIVTPSASIFHEMLEKFQYHFGKQKVGAFGDGKKTLGKQITVAISKSLSNVVEGSPEHAILKKTEVFLGDECFPSRIPILTSNGPATISSLYSRFIKGEELFVQSLNQTSGEFELKRVTNAWKKPEREKLLKIAASGFTITCTEDHQLLTEGGWKQAKQIEAGDFLFGKRGVGKRSSVNFVMNEDQEQIFLGSYLGDGSASVHKNGVRMRIIHSVKQEEYLRWKAAMFNIVDIARIKKNGYSQTPAVRFATPVMHTKISMTSPKGGALDEVLAKLDSRGLAIWVMDDGSYSGNRYRLHTESLPMADQIKIVTYFKIRFGLVPKISLAKKPNKTYFYLQFDECDSERLSEIINPYLHRSMKYKTIGDCESFSYIWDDRFKSHGFVKVSSVTEFFPKKELTYKRDASSYALYDLEIDENHNFLVGNNGGIVAHNCHTLPAESLEKVCHGLLETAPYRFFFSGTPTRGDGTEKLLRSIIGKEVYSIGAAEAVAGGYICPHEYRIVSVPPSNSNFTSNDPLEIKRVHFLNNSNVLRFAAKLANAEARANQKQTLILVEEMSQVSALAALITVPFAIAHSEANKARLLELGLKKVKPNESVEKFNRGEAMVLIGTSCISTGTNIYNVHHCINLQGGISETKVKQGAIGRSTRFARSNPFKNPWPAKTKSIIWDFDVKGIKVLERHLAKRIEYYEQSGSEIKFIKI
jgi:superfamily II DNA or RNA helicase